MKQDQAEAMRLYLKAADSGDMKAPRDVGVNYEFGKGTPVDYRQPHDRARFAA